MVFIWVKVLVIMKRFESFRMKEIDDNISGLEYLSEFLSLGVLPQECKLVSFVNPFSYSVLRKNKDLIKYVDYWHVDGGLLCKLYKYILRKKYKRVSFDFSSLADLVFTSCETHEIDIALIGGNNKEILSAIDFLENKYPELKVAFSRNGYFSSDEDMQSTIVDVINSNAKVVIVGLGTPLQEKFLSLMKNNSGDKVLLGFTCGGFISQTSLRGDYYHPIIKKTKLFWLQRAFMHSHVRKRLLNEYPKFLFNFICDKNFFKM